MKNTLHKSTVEMSWGGVIASMITVWAIYTLLMSPIQLTMSLLSDKWHTPDGAEIPYKEFPSITIFLMVILCVSRVGLLFSALWRVRNLHKHIARYGMFTEHLHLLLRKTAKKLLAVGIIDFLSFSLPYLSLVLLEPRVAFDIKIFALLLIIISPDKLLLGGLAYAGSNIIRRGVEIEDEIKLTV